jgi:farnesyl diphosphate synthase
LDCYGAPEVIGKIGTDIQDNKCGWLIVKALEIATEEQKETLKVLTINETLFLYIIFLTLC